MDRKSRRSVAVTAGLAAVLALSPVVAPAVTALAQETSETTSTVSNTDLDLDMDRFALNKHVVVDFHDEDGAYIDTVEADVRFTLTNYKDYVPALDVVNEFLEKHPEYADAQWSLINNDRAPLNLETAGFGSGLCDYVDETGLGHCHVDLYVYAPKPATVTVNFDANWDEGTDRSVEVEVGETVSKLDNPTRDGYDFAGWYTDADCTQVYDFSTPVTGDLTLYAKWTPVVDPDPEPTPDPDPEPTPDPEPEPTPDPETKTFSVTLNDGLAGTEDQIITIAEGETIDSSAIKAPTYDGWTFVGWFADSDLTQEWDFSTPVTSDMTLWAGWLRNDVDGSGVTDDTETTTDDVEKDANKAEKDNDPAVPDTGDATVAVYGIAAVGAALTGAGALIRRRR